jgi:hypothetical protein
MSSSLDLTKTYTSYSGVDIKVVVNGTQIGSMQAISYAIQREKAPIYVMGKVDPISFSRGKRGIAGTMISILLDKHFLHSDAFMGSTAVLDADEFIAPGSQSSPNAIKTDNGIIGQVLTGAAGTPVTATGTNADPQLNATLTDFTGTSSTISRLDGNRINAPVDVSSLTAGWRIAPVAYVDQILPFDVAIVAVNEYGQSAQMRIYGCEILNEGSGFSIDDIVVENQMTYVCRTILPWRGIPTDTIFKPQDLKVGSQGRTTQTQATS